MSATSPHVQLVNVARSFDAPGGDSSLAVLRDVTLDVAAGETLAIVGPSGSGKSTLLHIIGTLDRPSQGQVIFNGQDLQNLTDTQLATFRNRSIGFVFQAHYLLPQCS